MRAFLRARELRRQHRAHRPADDRRLDHRARVDAHDGRAVVQRVEEVVAVVGVDRVVARRAETRHARQIRHRIASAQRWKLYGCGRTSTLRVAQRRVAAGAQRLRSSGARTPPRRSDSEMKLDEPVNSTNGPASGSPTRAQKASRSRVTAALEPAVEQLRAGDRRPSPRDVVVARTASRFCASFQTSTGSGSTRSSPLLVRLSQLATQTAVRMPHAARRLDPVHLLRRRGHQRRHQQHVRRLLRAGTRAIGACTGIARSTRRQRRSTPARTVPTRSAAGSHPASDRRAAAPCASMRARSAGAAAKSGCRNRTKSIVRAHAVRDLGSRSRSRSGTTPSTRHAVGVGLQPFEPDRLLRALVVDAQSPRRGRARPAPRSPCRRTAGTRASP